MKYVTAVTDKMEAFLELGGAKKNIALLIISGIALLISIFDVVPLPFDSADIALVDDEVKELPHLLGLAKRMMITIKCNLTFSMALNFAGTHSKQVK